MSHRKPKPTGCLCLVHGCCQESATLLHLFAKPKQGVKGRFSKMASSYRQVRLFSPVEANNCLRRHLRNIYEYFMYSFFSSIGNQISDLAEPLSLIWWRLWGILDVKYNFHISVMFIVKSVGRSNFGNVRNVHNQDGSPVIFQGLWAQW
ncbi:hypothetical protein B0H14DRAFT_2574338 [Mycena olivaceomarginata]|nr:hypothetical protein B0H14DRAFT_2574338 [Mycena olivaceomarginata]